MVSALGDGGPWVQGLAGLLPVLALVVLWVSARLRHHPVGLVITAVPAGVFIGTALAVTAQGQHLLRDAIADYGLATHGAVVRSALDLIVSSGLITGLGLVLLGSIGALFTGLCSWRGRARWTVGHAVLPVLGLGLVAAAFPDEPVVVGVACALGLAWLAADVCLPRSEPGVARAQVAVHGLIATLGAVQLVLSVATQDALMRAVVAAKTAAAILPHGSGSGVALAALGCVVVLMAVASLAPIQRRPQRRQVIPGVLTGVVFAAMVAAVAWQHRVQDQATLELLSLDERAAVASLQAQDIHLPRHAGDVVRTDVPRIRLSRDALVFQDRYLGPTNATEPLADALSGHTGPLQLAADRDLMWTVVRPVLWVVHSAEPSAVDVLVLSTEGTLATTPIRIAAGGFVPPDDFMWSELVDRAASDRPFTVSLSAP